MFAQKRRVHTEKDDLEINLKARKNKDEEENA
jgi:hypothetical protein